MTDLPLRQVMSAMVVQKRHLWLNLAEMHDAYKVCFLNAPVSQASLFSDTVEDFAQQFSAVQKQTEATKDILPWRDIPIFNQPRTQSSFAHHRGCPTEAPTSDPSRI